MQRSLRFGGYVFSWVIGLTGLQKLDLLVLATKIEHEKVSTNA